MLIGEPLQQNKYAGGPRMFHTLLSKYLMKFSHTIQVIDSRSPCIEKNKIVQLVFILKIYYREKPSIIIVTTPGFHVLIVDFLRRISGAKVISVIHSLKRTRNYGKLKMELSLHYLRDEVLRDLLEKLLIEHSDIQIFPSKFFLERASIADYNPRNPIVIYHGIERELIIDKPRVRPPSNIILIVGSFVKKKGNDKIDKILQAISPKYQLYWVGFDRSSSQQRSDALKYANLNFLLLEYYSPKELVRILDQASVVLVPTYFESFNIAALEACARGIPVIVSSGAGIKDIVKPFGAGEECDFNSIDDIKRCNEIVFNDYERYSKNALRMASLNTWDSIIGSYIRVIDELTF